MSEVLQVQCVSNTVGGAAETRTVLQIIMYVRIRVKLYAPPHFVVGA